MASNASEREPIDRLADEFMARYRNGDRPELSEYTRQYPELADEIESLFPTLIMMEMAGSDMGREKANPIGLETNGRIPEQLGDYRLLREIGRGGMGIVYEAEQVSLGRHVALKVLPGHAHLEKRQLARFQREAQAAAALHHNHIVPVYGIGEQDGILFYAMQYIHGLGLDDVLSELRHSRWEIQAADADTKEAASTPNDFSVAIAHNLVSRPAQFSGCKEQPPSKPNGKPGSSGVSQSRRFGEGSGSHGRLDSGSEFSSVLLGESEESGRQNANYYFRSVARVGLEVADALAYAHSQGILHRDIKPSNLLMDSDGSVWVADFGLAKADDSDDLTNTGDIVGTIRYMAPERFKGWADPRSDVYSLGLTLYEMLTFRAAFDVNDRAHLLRSVAETSPPRPRRFDRKIPRDLETIVLKSTEKEPSQRYPNASALSDDLRRFLEDKPIMASRATWGERFRLWCKRSPVVASLAGLVTALLLMLTVGSVAAAIHFNTQSQQALKNLIRVEDAERLARKRLYDSLIAQAEAHRHSGQVGQRAEGLQAVKSALTLLPELEFSDEEIDAERLRLRNLAIACLALPDVQPEQDWRAAAGDSSTLTADDRRERYAYAVDGGEIRVHRIADDEELLRLPGEGWGVQQHGMMFCRDDQFLCAWYRQQREGKLYVWDLARKTAILQSAKIINTECAVSPDGSLLAVVSESKTITLFELPSARLVRKIPCGFPPHAVVFDPSSKFLAYGSPYFSTSVGIIDVKTGQLVREIENEAHARSIAWQDDCLATGGEDAVIRLWDPNTGLETARLKGHRAQVAALAFGKNADVLVSYAWDTTIRVWNPHQAKELLAFPARVAGRLGLGTSGDRLTYWVSPTQLRTAKVEIPRLCRLRGNQRAWSTPHSVSSDNRLLAAGVETDPDAIQIWDLPTAKLVSTMPGLRRGGFLSDGRTLVASSPQGIESWSLREHGLLGAPEFSIGPKRLIVPETRSNTFVIGGNERIIGSENRSTIGVADLAGERKYRLIGKNEPFNCVSISPDGKYATSGNFNGRRVYVWDVETGKVVFSTPLRTVRAAFSPDGRWLVTGTHQSFEFRRVGTWKLHHSVPRSWSGSLKGIMAFERTGRMMAISHSIHDTKLIDPQTGREFATLTTRDPRTVETLCFSPDGAWLIGTSDQLLFWDLRTIRQELSQMGLDWDLPKLSKASWGSEPKPAKIHWVGVDTNKKNVP